MDLSAAGLNPTETKCYEALLSKPSWKPADIAPFVQETRTNCYKILDKLCTLGLAERLDIDKKLQYRAKNPSQLLELARRQREAQEKAVKQLELDAQHLITNYIRVREQPGVSYFQGEEELGQIFQMISSAKEEVLFVHTRSGDDFYGWKVMHNLRMLAVNNGVHRRALTPDTEIATSDFETFDPTVLLKRTWLRQRDYSAPVEWGVFDDKLYIISYGRDALGIVIQSEPIADAFRQLFNLMESGQRQQPWYGRLPIHASIPGVSTPRIDNL